MTLELAEEAFRAEWERILGGQGFDQWLRTSNGDIIRPNLVVFTYDWKWGKVDAHEFERTLERNRMWVKGGQGFELTSNDFWFKVKYPDSAYGTIYNGERMTTMCPNCHGDFEGCDKSGCGQRKEFHWTGWK